MNESELLKIISRWDLRVEPYDGSEPDASSKAVYGKLPHGVEVLIAVIHENKVQSRINELIDDFLREDDPVLAQRLMEDVQSIMNCMDDLSALLEPKRNSD